VCNLFGYGEIKPSGSAYYSGSMLEVFGQIKAPNFHMITIEKKEDLWEGFRSFLLKDKASSVSAHGKVFGGSEGAASAAP
jgi:uncharacterized sporulation protein YeaH/YhbH (DUF444 family)